MMNARLRRPCWLFAFFLFGGVSASDVRQSRYMDLPTDLFENRRSPVANDQATLQVRIPITTFRGTNSQELLQPQSAPSSTVPSGKGKGSPLPKSSGKGKGSPSSKGSGKGNGNQSNGMGKGKSKKEKSGKGTVKIPGKGKGSKKSGKSKDCPPDDSEVGKGKSKSKKSKDKKSSKKKSGKGDEGAPDDCGKWNRVAHLSLCYCDILTTICMMLDDEELPEFPEIVPEYPEICELFTFAKLSQGSEFCTPTVLDQIRGFGDLDRFVALIELAGLQDIFLCSGPLTLLVPSNESFERIHPDDAELLVDPENVVVLREILLYHMIPGSYMETNFEAGPLESIQGENIIVQRNPLSFNDATLIDSDLLGCNGVAHIVSSVLIPPSYGKSCVNRALECEWRSTSNCSYPTRTQLYVQVIETLSPTPGPSSPTPSEKVPTISPSAIASFAPQSASPTEVGTDDSSETPSPSNVSVATLLPTMAPTLMTIPVTPTRSPATSSCPPESFDPPLTRPPQVTSTPAPTTAPAIRVETEDYFLAYNVPCLLRPPTDYEMELLLAETEKFYSAVFEDFFRTNTTYANVTFREVILTPIYHHYDLGIPREDFNYIVGFSGTLLYEPDSAPPPNAAMTTNIMLASEADYLVYILDYVRTQPQFLTTVEVFFNLQDTLPPNSIPVPTSAPAEIVQSPTLAPTSITETNTIRRVVKGFLAYVAPRLTELPSDSEVVELMTMTREFYDKVFRDVYQDQPTMLFRTVILEPLTHQFGAGIPEDQFNYYIPFDANFLYETDSDTPLSVAEHFSIMAQANYTDYILNYIRTKPWPLRSTTVVRFNIREEFELPLLARATIAAGALLVMVLSMIAVESIRTNRRNQTLGVSGDSLGIKDSITPTEDNQTGEGSQSGRGCDEVCSVSTLSRSDA